MNRIVGVVLAFALITVASWVAWHNEALLAQPLALWTLPGQTTVTSISVGEALLVSFGIGCLTVAVAWGVRVGKAIAAAIAARQAAREGRQAEDLYQRGLEAVLDARPDAALEQFKGVLARSPRHAGALMAGADILRARGRAAQAAEWRARRLEAAPDDLAALHALAEDHRAAGDLAGAAAALERAIAARPQNAQAALERLRDVHLEAGRHEEALAAHERLVKLHRRKDDAAAAEQAHVVRAGIETRWALALAEAGRAREAATLIAKVVKSQPDHAPARRAQFRVLLLDDREDEAVDALVAGYERTDDGTLLVAAEQHFLATRHEGDGIKRANVALATFKRLAACCGRRPLATAFLGKLYTRFEMLEEAAAAFERVREEFAENPTMTYYAARIAEKQGRARLAAERYRGILKRLDVLRMRFACRACGHEEDEALDRCSSCGAWGSLALEQAPTGVTAPEPAGRPVYQVPDDGETAVEQDALA